METILPAGLLIVLGVLSPLIVSVLTKLSMSRKAKVTVALAVSIGLGAFFLWATGGIALVLGAGAWAFFQSLVVAGGVVYALGQAIYQYVFKGTDLAGALSEVGIKDGETDANGSGFLEDNTEPELEDTELGD